MPGKKNAATGRCSQDTRPVPGVAAVAGLKGAQEAKTQKDACSEHHVCVLSRFQSYLAL